MRFCPTLSVGTLYSPVIALQACIAQSMARLQGLGLNIATPNIAGIFERGGLQYATSTDSIKGDRCTRGTLGVENSRAPLPEDFARRGFIWFPAIIKNVDTRDLHSSHISALLTWLSYIGQQVS